jgi:anti-sigma factor RsiW
MKPKSCNEFQELASAFIDDHLEVTGIYSLQRHLEGCRDCRRFLSELRRIRELVKAEEVHRALQAPSPGFTAALSRRLVEKSSLPPAEKATVGFFVWRPLWGRMAGAMMAAALLVFSGWAWYRLSVRDDARQVVSSLSQGRLGEEGSMEAYLRQHALRAMETTLLGPPEGLEFVDFGVVDEIPR